LSLQARILLDTHVLVRWLADSKKLSKEQLRTLEAAVKRSEPVALSAITLLEIAILVDDGKLKVQGGLERFLEGLHANPVFQLLPLTYEIAADVAMLSVLRDPADRVIAATARVHRLRLATSDQRIIQSKLVAVVE
jgi:PIN domain nuclease of toxin-antitoxin system